MQETDEMWVRFLGEKDPLEEEMGICSNILAWRIPWTEEPGGLPSTGLGQKESDMTEHVCTCTHTHTYTHTDAYEMELPLLLLSCFSHVRLCATPEMAAHQAPPSLGFSRQEHWSGFAISFSNA